MADRDKSHDDACGRCGKARTQAIVGMKANLIPEANAIAWRDETKELAARINGLTR